MKKQDEDSEIMSWISEHAEIEEIDDISFRQALFEGVNKRDSSRRFEIHNTELIYCLRAEWLQKVLPQEFGEEEHANIFLWISRKGIELGVVNVLKSLFPGMKTQRFVKLGRSKGSVDLDAQGEFYEITTRMFYGSQKNPKNYPPPDKVLQLITYLSGAEKTSGNVKVYILLPSKETVHVNYNAMLPSLKKDIKRYERTWRVTLKDEYFKHLFENRSEVLYNSLIAGDWRILPPEPFLKWKCKYCSVKVGRRKMTVCEYLEKYPDRAIKAWKVWNEERSRFVLKKWAKNMSKMDKLGESFRRTYGRLPTEQELDVFEEYLRMLERW